MRTHTSALLTAGSGLGRSFLSIGLAAAAITLSATGALFNDTATVGENTFATGTVELTTTPTTAIVARPADMAPGDTVTGTVTVTNADSLQYRYGLTSTTTAPSGSFDLASQITVTVWDEAAETSPDGTCGSEPGTTLYDGILGTDTGTPYFTGQTVDGAGSQLLCLQATLPSDTGNDYQGLTTTATFTFDAQQTANNSA